MVVAYLSQVNTPGVAQGDCGIAGQYRAMHTVIVYASADSPAFAQALRSTPLPTLARLLHTWKPGPLQATSPGSYCPLPEWVEACALGIANPSASGAMAAGADGLLAGAERQARLLGLPEAAADEGWAWITLCHWQVNADHVLLHDPAGLQLGAEDAQGLLQAMRPYFEEDGLRLYPGGQPGVWLACGRALRGLPTASLERVRGQALDAWLPESAPLRRLQNEMQMLLYTHPVNDVRAAKRLPLVNAFWISGTGSLPPGWQPRADVQVHTGLRDAVRAQDPKAWAQAWARLDAEVLAPLERASDLTATGADAAAVQLTLCGEQATQTWSPQALSFWQTLARRWRAGTPAADFLKNL